MFVPVKQCNYFTFPRESKHHNPARRFLRPNPSNFSFYLFIFKGLFFLCLELRNHKPNPKYSFPQDRAKEIEKGRIPPFESPYLSLFLQCHWTTYKKSGICITMQDHYFATGIQVLLGPGQSESSL